MKTSPNIHKTPQGGFSNNLIQIININSNNVSGSSPTIPFRNPAANDAYRYYDLIAKLDSIIEESRKTQQMIKEKQNKINSPPKPREENKTSPEYMQEIGKILEKVEIPNDFQSEMINNFALKRICQQNIYSSQADLNSPKIQKNSPKKIEQSHKITQNEENLMKRMEKIKEKSGFDMLKFVEDLYDLASKAQLDESSPNKKGSKFMAYQQKKIKNIGFEDCGLLIEEDFDWKKIEKQEKINEKQKKTTENGINLMFLGENVRENVEPKYFTHQAMECAYERLLGVYLTMKADTLDNNFY